MDSNESAPNAWPLVTVAVTTLNRPTYLAETISCVLAQDYPFLDILISDNGSTDETPILARAMAGHDPRVRFRRNEDTVAVDEHFSQCLMEARGQYFVLVSDDDRINSCFVSELTAVAVRHPEVNVVVPANVIIDERGQVVREFARPSTEVFDGVSFYCDWVQGRGPQVVADVTTVLLRADTARHFGGYQPFDGGRNIDNLMLLQCGLSGSVGYSRCAEFSWRRYMTSYGFTATPEQIGSSGRKFVQHLRTDPRTVEALQRIPLGLRRRVLRAVGEVTTLEVLAGMKHVPFNSRMLLRLFAMRRDAVFVYVVLREYLRRTYPTMHRWLRALLW